MNILKFQTLATTPVVPEAAMKEFIPKVSDEIPKGKKSKRKQLKIFQKIIHELVRELRV
ncbi:116_t:CDS:2 [Funneliformis caledonium]|uniref:116_t:CDS:1 n=1 Tax=Funneliformis caledonium TaxID=1117310 RepID=A0A9N9HC60_9GLOM|nr:116_t:CDS:2 [Funneliformis caledonium]